MGGSGGRGRAGPKAQPFVGSSGLETGEGSLDGRRGGRSGLGVRGSRHFPASQARAGLSRKVRKAGQRGAQLNPPIRTFLCSSVISLWQAEVRPYVSLHCMDDEEKLERITTEYLEMQSKIARVVRDAEATQGKGRKRDQPPSPRRSD